MLKMKHLRSVLLLLIVLFFSQSNAQTVLRGVILEEGSKKPIVARVGLKGEGSGVFSANNGRFLYRKYDQVISPESELLITADGYEPLSIKALDIRKMYNITSTIYLTPQKASSVKKDVSQKKLAVYLDISSSNKNQNFKKASAFVKSYIESAKISNVELLLFNDSVIASKKIELPFTYDVVVDALKNVIFEGATDYSLIDTSADVILLISDGYASLGKIDLNRSNELYILNSLPNGNHQENVETAKFYNGSYIPLFAATVDEAINRVRASSTFEISDFEKNQPVIKGVVSNSSGPIQGATISLQGTLDEYISRADGSFTIPATAGDVMQVRYLGMYPKDVLVTNSPVVEIEMIPQADMLDEVLLTGEAKSQEKKIDAGLGNSKSKETIGYSINTITEENIKPNATYLGDIIRGNFAGVQVLGPPGSEKFLIRGGNMSINNELPPLWVIDGAPFADVPYYLDPQNIKSITILKSAIATVRYGTIASGGAFLVKTKSANPDVAESKEKIDQALVKGNDYVETLSEMTVETAPYIAALDKESTIEAKYKRYLALSENFANSVSFYADNAEYFQKIAPNKAEQIRLRLSEIAGNNVKALRILSFLYEAAGSYKRNTLVNERIVALAPREAQSYRDLALAYSLSGDYNKSLELYINMLGERILGVDFSEIEGPLANELRHLVALHKDKIEYNRLPNEWLTNDFSLDIRMVIEWSEQDAPFIFQFVNPSKKYYTWNHTLFENKERLLNERKMGYQLEEFVIDDAKSGEWLVNIQYLGEEATFTIPPYLKYTMYRNYGTDKESKEIKIIKLSEQKDKVSLGRINLQ